MYALVDQDVLPAGVHRLRRRTRQHLEVPLQRLQGIHRSDKRERKKLSLLLMGRCLTFLYVTDQ